MTKLENFINERARLNEKLPKNINMQRFLNLDNRAYEDGKLSAKFKELLGLISSLVLRCDDCINYHLIQCSKAGLTTEELEEAVTIALIVGGSITIPHIRRLFEMWEEIKEKRGDDYGEN